MSNKETPRPAPKPWIRSSAEIMEQAQTMMSEAK